MIEEWWLPENQPRHRQVNAADICRQVLANWEVRNNVGRIEPREAREDCLSFLLEKAWVEHERYDPSRGVPFGVYLHRKLYHRPTDWLRSYEGRTRWVWRESVYERERETPVSLDAHLDVGDDHARSLGDILAAADRSTEADRDEAFGWLYHTRDSGRARDVRLLVRHARERNAERVQRWKGREAA
jgi:hypothetical protein